jgi:hypothetical protein
VEMRRRFRGRSADAESPELPVSLPLTRTVLLLWVADVGYVEVILLLAAAGDGEGAGGRS